MSSWECWWYAFSFGSRVMTDIYPLLAIVLGFTILGATKTYYKTGLFAFTSFCICLSLFQSFQSIKYIIHPERMTKEQYWHVFGKTEISDAYRLEIDRENTDWIDYLEGYQNRGINHQNKIVYSFKKPKTAIPTEDLSIEKFRLLDKVPNDETCFLVSFKAMTSDSTKTSLLRMETVSKYNCYGWDNYEISLGKTQNHYAEYSVKFNLKNIRHSTDQMQIYIDNDNDVEVKIKDFEIRAITLIRD